MKNSTVGPVVMCAGERVLFLGAGEDKVALGSCSSHTCKGKAIKLKLFISFEHL